MALVKVESGPAEGTPLSEMEMEFRSGAANSRGGRLVRALHKDCRGLADLLIEAEKAEWAGLGSRDEFIRRCLHRPVDVINMALEGVKLFDLSEPVPLDAAVSAADVHKRLLAEKRAAEPAAREGPGAPEGNVNNNPEAKVNCTNGTISFNGSDRDRADLRRLGRDHPDVAAQVVSGEISLNKAAIDAGFRKKKVQVEVSAEGFAKAIEKHLDEDQLAAFREWFTEYAERNDT